MLEDENSAKHEVEDMFQVSKQLFSSMHGSTSFCVLRSQIAKNAHSTFLDKNKFQQFINRNSKAAIQLLLFDLCNKNFIKCKRHYATSYSTKIQTINKGRFALADKF